MDTSSFASTYRSTKPGLSSSLFLSLSLSLSLWFLRLIRTPATNHSVRCSSFHHRSRRSFLFIRAVEWKLGYRLILTVPPPDASERSSLLVSRRDLPPTTSRQNSPLVISTRARTELTSVASRRFCPLWVAASRREVGGRRGGALRAQSIECVCVVGVVSRYDHHRPLCAATTTEDDEGDYNHHRDHDHDCDDDDDDDDDDCGNVTAQLERGRGFSGYAGAPIFWELAFLIVPLFLPVYSARMYVYTRRMPRKRYRLRGIPWDFFQPWRTCSSARLFPLGVGALTHARMHPAYACVRRWTFCLFRGN